MKRLDVHVANLDCEQDAAALRRSLAKTPGLEKVEIYWQSARVSLVYDPEITGPETLRERLNSAGYPTQQALSLPVQPKPWRNPKIITSAVAGLLLLAGWLFSLAGASSWLVISNYSLAIVIGGYYFGREAVEDLIFERRIGIELLMGVAAVIAAAVGQPAEAAMLVFLYSISEAAEGYTEDKTRTSVRALMDLAPKKALVVREGEEQEIPVEELAAGDRFIVLPGQSIPTDGIIVSGSGAVNQSPVTGESVPVDKTPGDPVLAGTLNGSSSFEVEANKDFADNTLSRIINMVEEAQERKSGSQRFIERFGARYSPAVLVLGILVAVIPPLVTGAEWDTWLTRAAVFIVASAPCALVISIPVTMVATLGTGARKGVLIKGGRYIEELSRIRVVALDKTGTITRGKPVITQVIVFSDSMDETDLITVAAGIEKRSEHPLAQAIMEYARMKKLEAADVYDFKARSGVGAVGMWRGRRVFIGNAASYADEMAHREDHLQAQIERLEGEGKTVIALGSESDIWGLIAMRDQIRPNSIEAIKDLHRIGMEKIVMLTGDNRRSAGVIAREAGIDHVHSGLKPEDKVAEVRKLADSHGHVAMVGDGINDAPALAEATVGVAMGAAGTDVALETADVALMADDLKRLVYAIELARRNQSVVKQNLFLSILVISLFALGAISGVLTLPLAIIGHELSEFVVIGNGLRMLRA